MKRQRTFTSVPALSADDLPIIIADGLLEPRGWQMVHANGPCWTRGSANIFRDGTGQWRLDFAGVTCGTFADPVIAADNQDLYDLALKLSKYDKISVLRITDDHGQFFAIHYGDWDAQPGSSVDVLFILEKLKATNTHRIIGVMPRY